MQTFLISSVSASPAPAPVEIASLICSITCITVGRFPSNVRNFLAFSAIGSSIIGWLQHTKYVCSDKNPSNDDTNT